MTPRANTNAPSPALLRFGAHVRWGFALMMALCLALLVHTS
jgi:hypothetical protein